MSVSERFAHFKNISVFVLKIDKIFVPNSRRLSPDDAFMHEMWFRLGKLIAILGSVAGWWGRAA